MYRFWNDVIRPVLKEAHVGGRIVEIGSEIGNNTFNILNYCLETGAQLTVIDPLPGFDVESLEKEFPFFTFMKDTSLNALPRLNDMEAVLIDGDHNWYTVYHELKWIESSVLQQRFKFPLVFLHDTEWPYARRDMYYNPDTIPEAFRKPYANKGILQGQSELIDPESELGSQACNAPLNNAIYEGGERNGVLTAIEDFMKGSPLNLTFITISPHNGLGILFESDDALRVKIEAVISNSGLNDL